MAFSPCFPPPQLSLKINRSVVVSRLTCSQRFTFALKCTKAEIYGQRVPVRMSKLLGDWSFMVGSRISIRPNVRIFQPYRRSCVVRASWLASSQIASSVLTLGTAAVLPFYTLMVLAPKAELTKKSMESAIPYIVLGLLYAYLVYLSWTPDTIRLLLGSQYWLPELSGIAKMFSNEMTLASAWIHLLAVDLFAARQVFHDGLESETETRHSVSLCMLCCPVGIVSHVLTKGLTKTQADEESPLLFSLLVSYRKMALSPCFSPSQSSLKINRSEVVCRPTCNQRFTFALRCTKAEIYGQRVPLRVSNVLGDWSFMVGSRISMRPNLQRFQPYRRSCVVRASWSPSSQIASSVFTLGTAAVLPFYTLMVLAPKAELTKKSMESSIPYIVLGLLYAYLLYLSWTPDTLRLMFASKYWLPELSGIAKMFSNEMTLASAWIHLLAVDLFAARSLSLSLSLSLSRVHVCQHKILQITLPQG
ncbi:hypothetical protein RHGRI_028702 [Rhododendron griersonianum]|uniref:Neoxanthin synthase n=1 Tax=Rhododendron griersonianum TaxID=479676 RepID=A0AAV6IHH1_9ERIC|nr:hypothetical protein RHGRI_028702 [Rhododendron griersonianum]